MVLSVSVAVLIGVLAHSALYGIYLVFFIGALYVAYTRRLRGDLKGVNMFLFTVSIILFLLITTGWVVQILRMVDAFIYRIDGNPDIYYVLTTPQNTANIALGIGETIVADSTMVYRLYIVWGRSLRVVLLPLILTVGLIGAGCGVVYLMIAQAFVPSSTGRISTVISFFGATLILNLAISALISYRIWSINREVAGLTSGRKTYSIVYVLLENAMLYLACVGSSLVGFILGGAYQFILLNATGPVIGISFCLIIVWVGLGMGVESTSQVVSDVRFRYSNDIPERSICI